jgi:HSP20 family molecular chaperone IbpA
MEKHLSPSQSGFRPMSPLKSPLLRRHLSPIEANIHYPAEFASVKPVFKQVLIGKDGFFRAAVDVHDYKPDEIKLKTIGHTILIELKHEEKEDEFGFISRNFRKKFVLPPNMDIEKISSWTSGGVLYLKVPSLNSQKPERVIEIKHEAASA